MHSNFRILIVQFIWAAIVSHLNAGTPATIVSFTASPTSPTSVTFTVTINPNSVPGTNYEITIFQGGTEIAFLNEGLLPTGNQPIKNSPSYSSLSPNTSYSAELYVYNATAAEATSTIPFATPSEQATPSISWSTPAAITYGTAINSTQLDASSTVGGTYIYTLDGAAVAANSGTVPAAGSYTLGVTFNPADSTDYTSATGAVTLTVNKAALTVTADSAVQTYSGSPFSGGNGVSYTGFVNGDNATSLGGSLSYGGSSQGATSAGTYSIIPDGLTSSNYTINFENGILTINKATPSISWSTPAAITYGTAINSTQLNASSPVEGTFSYTLGGAPVTATGGTVPAVGSQMIVATFTPTDTTDYSMESESVTLIVDPAANPAATHFSVSAPASSSAGSAFSVTVTALDSSNDTATGYAGTVNLTSSDSQALLPANATLTNGVGAFSVTLRTVGTQTVTATDTVTSSITGTSSGIAVSSSQAATHLLVVAPATAAAGSPINFSVTALNSSNNAATGYTGTVHFTSSDSQALLPANATLTNGVGAFSVTLKTVGTQTVTAIDTVTSSIAGTSSGTAVSAGQATHFSVNAPATATAGTSLKITVTALDASNNTATTYSGTVHFTSSDGSASLPANATLTNGTGTFSATFNTTGTQTVTATDTVTSSITGTSNGFSVSTVSPPAIPSMPSPANEQALNSPPTMLAWASGPDTLYYNVYLSAGGGGFNEVASNLSSPQWSLNQSYNGATVFEWFVVAVGDTGLTAQGPTWTYTVNLPAPTLSIVTPSAGQSLKAGTTQTVSWTASGSVAQVATFDVQLSINNGVGFTDLAPTGLSGSSRSWSWAIPANLSASQAMLEVFAVGSSGGIVASAVSTGSFSIAPPNATGSVSGLVFDNNGNPVANAAVTAAGASATTNAQGNYTLSALSPGSVTVAASEAGYVPTSKSATVTAGQTSTVNLNLIPQATVANLTPSVTNVTSQWCSVSTHCYFLNGIGLPVTFTPVVNWPEGLTPGQIVWTLEPSGVVIGSALGNQTFNVGLSFGVGAKLQVQAVSTSGKVSAPYIVNFDIISPPGSAGSLPFFLLQPSLAGNSLSYSSSLTTGASGLDMNPDDQDSAIPSSFPMCAGEAFQFNPTASANITIMGDGTGTISGGPGINANIKVPGGGSLTPLVSLTANLAYSASTQQWNVTSGSFTVGVNAQWQSPTYYYIFLLGPVPVPIYTQASGSVGFTFSANIVGWSSSGPLITGVLSFQTSLQGVLGVGVSGLFDVEGYLNGAFMLNYTDTPNTQFALTSPPFTTCGLDLTGGIQVTALFYQYQNNLLNYPYSFLNSSSSPSAALARRITSFNRMDLSQFKPIPRTYLRSKAAPAPPSRSRIARKPLDTTASSTTVQSNVYPWSQSKLRLVPGNLLLTWVTDNPSRSDTNRTELVSMAGNGSNWSTAIPIWDDGTPDFQPSVATIPSGVLVAWAKAGAPEAAGATLPTVLASMGIAVAQYNASSGTWSGAQRLTNTGYLQRNPVLVAASDGTAMLVWISNQADDMLGSASNPNSIMYSRWNGSAWSAPAVAASGIGAIVKADLAYDGSSAVFVYSLDADADLTTTADRNLQAIQWNGTSWSNPIAITNDTSGNDQPKLVYSGSGNLLLFWSRQDGIVSASYPNNAGTPQAVVPQQESSGLSDFTIASNTGGSLALVWQASVANGADLYSEIFDPTQNIWGKPQQLTNDPAMDRSEDICFDASGNLQAAFDRVAITAGINPLQMEEVDLCTATLPIQPALALASSDIILSDPNPPPGENVTITATVYNTGGVAASSVPVAFYDGNPSSGGVLISTQTIQGPLASGNAQPVSAPWTVPAALVPQNLYVVIDPNHTISGANESNAIASITVLEADLAIGTLTTTVVGNNTALITAQVSNIGALASPATAVTFHLGSPSGPLIGTEAVATLSPGSMANASLSWNYSSATILPDGLLVYAIVDEAGLIPDFNRNNNTGQVLLDAGTLTPLQIVSESVSGAGTIAFTVSGPNLSATNLGAQGTASLSGTVQWTELVSTATALAGESYEVSVTIPQGVAYIRLTEATGTGSVTSVVLATAIFAPSISVQPQSQTLNAGSNLQLGVTASGSGTLTYQWYLNGTALAGETTSTFTLSNIGTAQAGSYTVVVGNGSGQTTTSNPAIVTVNVNSRLVNLSTRAFVGPGAETLVTGFITSGSASKNILIRGVGPTLSQYSVSGALANPQLSLFDANSILIASDTGWGTQPVLGTSTTSATVQQATSVEFSQVGAFALPAGSADCALFAMLPSATYTAQIASTNGGTGIALAELYDADPGSPSSRLVNISSRALVGNGSQNMVAGFIISGSTSETVLIRAVGPTLANFGVNGVLANLSMTLFDSSSNAIVTNVGWGNAAVLGSSTVQAGVEQATAAVMGAVGAFSLPANSADCALIVTLPPGTYTAQVSGVGNGTGIALLEVYDVP